MGPVIEKLLSFTYLSKTAESPVRKYPTIVRRAADSSALGTEQWNFANVKKSVAVE